MAPLRKLNATGIKWVENVLNEKNPSWTDNSNSKVVGIDRKTLLRVTSGKQLQDKTIRSVERALNIEFGPEHFEPQEKATRQRKRARKKAAEKESTTPTLDQSPSETTQLDLESSSGSIRPLTRLGSLFTTTPTSTKRDKLLRRVSDDIDQRIEAALGDGVRDRFPKISLEREDNLNAVGRDKRRLAEPDNVSEAQFSYTRVLSLLGKSQKTVTELGSDQRIFSEFRSRGIPLRLLILGAPGSGKTTELIELAYDLLTEAREQESAPIPLIFELSSWMKDKPIKDWLIEQSKRIYSISESDCRKWLEEEEILPLLDGLDELGVPMQKRCIEAIDDFIKDQGYPYTVVCCRIEEYETGKLKFKKLRYGLTLKPLDDDIIQNYLIELQRFRFWDLAQGNEELYELVHYPLYLSLLVTVDNKNQAITNSEDLFNAFIENEFSKSPKDGDSSHDETPSQQECLHYLCWLAQKMEKLGKTEFLIEELQPSWLSLEKQNLYFEISRLILFLICAVPSALTFAAWCGFLSVRIFFGDVESSDSQSLITPQMFFVLSLFIAIKVFNLYAATCTFVLTSNEPPIKLYEKVSFYPERVSRILLDLNPLGIILNPLGIILSVTLSLCFLFLGKKLLLDIPLFVTLWIFGSIPLLMTLTVKLPVVYRLGLAYQTIAEKGSPNQGIHNTLRNCVLCMTPGVIAGMLVTFILSAFGWRVGLPLGLATGYCIATYLGLNNGLATLVQHYVLRFLLNRERNFPVDCVSFLEHVRELRFMQKVGGRYRFLHELLRKHFATGKLPDYSEL